MVETLTYKYTTQAEMERAFSTAAVTARTDDGVLADLLDDCINEATDEINFHCERWYEPSDMVNNLWVRRTATWLACYYLSQRMGNPAQFETHIEEIKLRLEHIYSGHKQIPRLATRDDMTPAMSNLRVDDRFRVEKIRVQPTISTGGSYSKQDKDPVFPAGGWP